MVELLGIVLSLLAAIALSLQTLSIRIGTDTGSPTDALVVVLFINIIIYIPMGVHAAYPVFSLSLTGLGAFIAAGITGTLLGRIFYYTSVERLGASYSEPIKASQPLYATLAAVVVLEETLTPGNLIGVVFIVVGAAIVSLEGNSKEVNKTEAMPGSFVLPFIAAFFYGIEPLFAEIGLAEGAPFQLGLAVKTIAATFSFIGYLWWQATLPTRQDLLGSNLKWYVAAGVANTIFLTSYYSALGISRVVVVAPIINLSPLFVAGLSIVFLSRREQVTKQLIIGTILITAGATGVAIYG